MKPRTLRRKLQMEAALALIIAGVAVQVVPAARLLAWAARSPRRPRRFADPGIPLLVAKTVDRVGSRWWMRAVCLPRAIATQAMLRRRGIASRLCLGVARDGRSLAAHAWVEVGREIVIGQTDEPFTPVAQLG